VYALLIAVGAVGTVLVSLVLTIINLVRHSRRVTTETRHVKLVITSKPTVADIMLLLGCLAQTLARAPHDRYSLVVPPQLRIITRRYPGGHERTWIAVPPPLDASALAADLQDAGVSLRVKNDPGPVTADAGEYTSSSCSLAPDEGPWAQLRLLPPRAPAAWSTITSTVSAPGPDSYIELTVSLRLTGRTRRYWLGRSLKAVARSRPPRFFGRLFERSRTPRRTARRGSGTKSAEVLFTVSTVLVGTAPPNAKLAAHQVRQAHQGHFLANTKSATNQLRPRRSVPTRRAADPGCGYVLSIAEAAVICWFAYDPTVPAPPPRGAPHVPLSQSTHPAPPAPAKTASRRSWLYGAR
jgi:hypothetical protein